MARRSLAPLLCLAVILAGCAPTSSGSPSGGEPVGGSLHILIPFPSPLTYYAVYLAEARGFYAEENLEVQIDAADGSGAVVQQLIAGNADGGFSSVNPVVNAASQGQQLVSFYVLSTHLVYSLVAPASSGITTVADLEGGSIGISEPTGGEVLYISGLLSTEDIDAELIEVGGPDTASLALDEGRIDAYISAVNDIVPLQVIYEEKGEDLEFISLAQFEDFFDSAIMVTPEFLEENASQLTGFGRAIAKATVWGMENPEGAVALMQDAFPEAVTDCDFAVRQLAAGDANRALTPAMNGQWGYNVGPIWQEIADFLLEAGEITEPVDTSTLFTNDLIDDINAFDADAIRADAAAFDEEPEC